jgi:hypothetical protein
MSRKRRAKTHLMFWRLARITDTLGYWSPLYRLISRYQDLMLAVAKQNSS